MREFDVAMEVEAAVEYFRVEAKGYRQGDMFIEFFDDTGEIVAEFAKYRVLAITRAEPDID